MSSLGRRIDLHMHSFLSDGSLVPSGIARRAAILGYEAIALTDHADASNLDFVVKGALKAAEQLSTSYDLIVVPGVELTHVPPERIPQLVKEARSLGAKLVVVHGETIVEPVARGTNRIALGCETDLLAHPGLITEGEAELARDNGIFLELTSRKGHCLANGHVAKVVLQVGAKLVVNTDMHDEVELISQEQALKVALAAGLPEAEAVKAVRDYPRELLRKIGY